MASGGATAGASACLLAIAGALLAAPAASAAAAPSVFSHTLGWYGLSGAGPRVGAVDGTGNACCATATCVADHRCEVDTCAPGGASMCSQYSCSNCECCPCCGTGEYCFIPSGASGPGSGKCCKNGYGGPQCETPICTPPCSSHGNCTAPSTCTCDSGWGGAQCDEPACDGKTTGGCGTHGTCVSPNTCKCDDGWQGPLCAAPVCDPPCTSHGNCTAPSTCTCDPGFSGPTCAVADCPQGCVHGVCQSPGQCVCTKGWQGNACNDAICTPPCSSHGNCTAPSTCTCASGWGGAQCDEPACGGKTSGGCGPHGTCVSPNTCKCAKGWQGPLCAAPVCDPPCSTHGNCTAPDTCTCLHHWIGPDCSTPVCGDPCVHGRCVSADTCQCDTGWSGSTCDVCTPDAYAHKDLMQGGFFTITDWYLGGCQWASGVAASGVLSGTLNNKLILSGSAEWKIYETGVADYVASGDIQYFNCSDEDICNPHEPIALALDDPTSHTSGFNLTVPFKMVDKKATGQFRVMMIGQDQDGFPYDFSVEFAYNYTDSTLMPTADTPYLRASLTRQGVGEHADEAPALATS